MANVPEGYSEFEELVDGQRSEFEELGDVQRTDRISAIAILVIFGVSAVLWLGITWVITLVCSLL
jgi:hypothetical protein